MVLNLIRNWLKAILSTVAVEPSYIRGEGLVDFFGVFFPVGTKGRVNTIFSCQVSSLSDALSVEANARLTSITRSKLDNLVEAITKEVIFFVGQSVEHLDCAKTKANVEDLVNFRLFLDVFNVSNIVVEAVFLP